MIIKRITDALRRQDWVTVFIELLLVVVGILLALQITNWNEERIRHNEETQLIQKIIDDLEIDGEVIAKSIDRFTIQQSVNNQVFKETQGTAEFSDEVPYQQLRIYVLFELAFSTNHTDSIKKLSNNELRQEMQDYLVEERYVFDALMGYKDYKEQHVWPIFTKHGIYNTKKIYSADLNDYTAMMQMDLIDYDKMTQQYGSVEFDQMLFTLGIKVSFSITQLGLLDEKRLELIETLKKELETRSG